MFRLKPTFAAVIFVALVSMLQLPSAVEAAVTVEDPVLVKKKINRNHITYVYRLSINNDGPRLTDVRVFVSSDNPDVRIRRDIVRFGDISANSITTSRRKFRVIELVARNDSDSDSDSDRKKEQQNQGTFDPASLRFEIGFDATLTVSGVATDTPLSDSNITGTITRPAARRAVIESGRPATEEFSTTADADGNFTLDVVAVTPDDFVTLRADGVANQAGYTLTSTVGSVDSLHSEAPGDALVVSSDDVEALDVTHISTALAVLAEQVNGVPITSDAALAAGQSGVEGAKLLTMAAVIKTVINNDNVALPAGTNNTLDLVSDPVALDDFIEVLETNFANEFQAALNAPRRPGQGGYSPAEVPGAQYFALFKEQPLFGRAFVFDFEAGGTGSVLLNNGSASIAAWTVNADGHIVVDLFDSPVSVSFDFCTYPGQTVSQCQALSRIDQVTLVRLVNGTPYDQVYVLARTLTTFPDDPVPDEIMESARDENSLFLGFRNDGIVPFQPAELSGARIATYYVRENNNSIGLANPDLGADFLTFNSNGTGSTDRRNFVFSWEIDADGIADVTFANGDNNRYVRVRDNGGISRVINVVAQANGKTAAHMFEAVAYDGVSAFTEAMLLNRRYRGLFAIVDPVFDFDYLFLPGGTGCRRAPSPQRLEWTSTLENFMDSFLFSDIDSPPIVRQRRAWEVITVVPGILGDRYWVLELADFSDFTDTYVFADPAVTPGRINAYEFIEDLTGVMDPCAP